ncbi:hypothetical protein H8E88_30405 [candidate division KSB1 bacterium]|nr:hypothetical protein [candidate division KSB1 bacterium]
MNKCWHCKKEFSFWEVWLSYWSGWKIQCSSCRKRQTVYFSKRFFIILLTNTLPLIMVFSSRYFLPSFSMGYLLVGFFILGFFLSLFVPLFKIYGE